MFPRRRREWVKILQWSSLAVLLLFCFVEPNAESAHLSGALSTHFSVDMGLALVVLALFGLCLSVSLSGRPGSKLFNPMATPHRRSLFSPTYALPVAIIGSALAGLTAPYLVEAFRSMAFNHGVGSIALHQAFQGIHEVAFDALTVLVMIHAAFHISRHFNLRDDALRIMIPTKLPRFL